jgi:uncharacterized protein (TIGR01777 family)
MSHMRIVMAGGSGFLGVHLRDALTGAGHQVVRLVRGAPRRPDEISWRPAEGGLDASALAGAGAVINLAGATIGRPWTAGYRRTLRSSRIDTTGTIARTLAALPEGQRPATLVNASAVGWYGDTGDREVTEEAPAGEGFMADLCADWEAATAPAEDAGVRVVRLRSAPVLHRGALLKPQLPVFQLGLGGRLGSGRQWVAWISLPDWLAAARVLLDRADLSGPANLVAPGILTNAAFTAALGRAVHRPAVLWVPGVALRLALGGLADEALFSHRAVPGVLDRIGFRFRHPDVDGALRAALANG